MESFIFLGMFSVFPCFTVSREDDNSAFLVFSCQSPVIGALRMSNKNLMATE